jgi:hypothetical protein
VLDNQHLLFSPLVGYDEELKHQQLASKQAASKQVSFMPKFRSLTTLLTVSFMAVAILPMAILVTFSSQTILKNQIENSGNSLAELANFTLDIMYRNLFERDSDVRAFALSPIAVAMNPDYLTKTANSYAHIYQFYDLMMITDEKGTIVATNTHDFANQPLPQAQQLLGQSLAKEPWFAAALLTGVGTAEHSDVEINPLVAKACGNSGAVLRFFPHLARWRSRRSVD